MRGFDVRVLCWHNGNLLIGTHACWGGLVSPEYFVTGRWPYATPYADYNGLHFREKEIYIGSYEQPETKDYQKLLVDVVNQMS